MRYQWIAHNGCIGKVENIIGAGLIVRWLIAKRPFTHAPLETFFSSGAVLLASEPRLTAALAARYLDCTRAWIYELNQHGAFGGVKRVPFWVLPSELDVFLNEQQKAA